MADVHCGLSSEEFTEGLDPRIQVELERLNVASEEINKLEKEIDEARQRFSSVFSESSQKLEALHRKSRRAIEKSRPYYDAVAAAKKAHSESQRAASFFRRARSIYDAAKETIQLAELRLRDGTLGEVQLDEAWQEMLTNAKQKMLDAEKEKVRGDLEHHRRSSAHAEAQELARGFKRKLRQHIDKSWSYYEKKAEFELQLQQQKQNIEDLQNAVIASKAKYKDALSNLEHISDEIHERRRSCDNLQRLEALVRGSCTGGSSDADDADDAYPDLETDLDRRPVRCVLGSSSLYGEDDEDDDDDDDDDVDVDSLLSSDSTNSASSAGSAPCSATMLQQPGATVDDDSDSTAWSSPRSGGTLERGQAPPTCDSVTKNHAAEMARVTGSGKSIASTREALGDRAAPDGSDAPTGATVADEGGALSDSSVCRRQLTDSLASSAELTATIQPELPSKSSSGPRCVATSKAKNDEEHAV